MKYLILDDLNSFQGIGSKCSYTCCKDWQVRIDSISEKYYRNVKGKFGEKWLFRGNGGEYSCAEYTNYAEALTKMFGDYMIPVRGTQEHEYPFYKKQQKELKSLLEKNPGVCLPEGI